MEIIDPIFNLHKIKFDYLDKWGLVNPSITRANVYINLDNVFKMLINPRVNNFIQASASVDSDTDGYFKQVSRNIVANTINLGQHYRLWLAKHSMESRIVLFWNNPMDSNYINANYIPTYRRDYQDRYHPSMENAHIVSAIKDAMEFCKSCIQYVNEVYLVTSDTIEGSLIPYLLEQEVYQKDGIKTRNILISSSSYDFSYTDYGFVVLVPPMRKKDPYFVTSQNVMEVLKNRAKVSSVISAPSNFVEFLIALLGDHDRNIPSISGVGIVTILKILTQAISEGFITEDTKDIQMLSDILKSDYKEIFQRNYHCTNLEYQYKDLTPLDIHKVVSQLVDNYDEATLNEMNEKYFKLSPIELIRPKSEQVLYDRNPYTSIFSGRK